VLRNKGLAHCCCQLINTADACILQELLQPLLLRQRCIYCICGQKLSQQ
jgi:hypothetical protein